MTPPVYSVFVRRVLSFRATLLLALVAGGIICLVAVACPAIAQDSNATTDATTVSASPVATAAPFIVIEGYVNEAPDIRDRPGVLIPVPGAKIYLIHNNLVIASTTSNAVGFYSVAIPAGDYTVVAAVSGFQTLIVEETFTGTQTFNIGMTPIPFNGFVPYALYPVLETSPGRVVECTMIVENFQVVDQMVTFTVVTPPEWQAWFPQGEALMIRSGDSNELVFSLKYVGKQQGAHTMKVVVNGGTYFAEVPVIVVVKDLPYESMDFYAYSPERTIKPGNTADFILNAENKYAQDKDLNIRIDDIPANWSATTGNGTEFFVPDGKIGSTHFYVYVPSETQPGNYTMNVTLCGEGVKSNKLTLKIYVEGAPLYDAIIKSHNRSAEGFPEFNVSTGTAFAIPVRVYNSWDFPVSIQASAQIADNWPYYFDGVPGGRLKIEPGKAEEFNLMTAVPNGTYGNYTIRVYLESSGRDMTLIGHITVPAPAPSPTPGPPATHGWEGPAITGITAGAILITIAASLLRRIKF